MTRAVVLVACLFAACSPSHAPHISPGSGSPAVPVLPDVPFADLDRAQREEFMRERVVPRMKALFQEHDARRFHHFGCATCHGETVGNGTYAMPSGKLPPLDPKTWKQTDADFMERLVVPAMARLLRRSEGFDCLACHTRAP
jgi:hypothetical protein